MHLLFVHFRDFVDRVLSLRQHDPRNDTKQKTKNTLSKPREARTPLTMKIGCYRLSLQSEPSSAMVGLRPLSTPGVIGEKQMTTVLKAFLSATTYCLLLAVTLTCYPLISVRAQQRGKSAPTKLAATKPSAADQQSRQRADVLLAQMTLDEKIGQMNQLFFFSFNRSKLSIAEYAKAKSARCSLSPIPPSSIACRKSPSPNLVSRFPDLWL